MIMSGDGDFHIVISPPAEWILWFRGALQFRNIEKHIFEVTKDAEKVYAMYVW